jgi:MFS family permease
MRLGRFAAAEVRPVGSRGQAISGVVAGGAAGSVFGPLLIGPSEQLAQRFGIPGLAGPFMATVVLLALASLVIFVFLRPDPRDVGRKIAELFPEIAVHQGPPRRVSQILRTPASIVAVVAMIAGQVAMAMLTGMVGLHMLNNLLSLTDISIVAAAHTFGMFAFSLVAGRLADRWGRGPAILSGTVLLALSCAIAPISSQVIPLAIALFLLGVGWNLSYVGGSALLSDQLSPDERSRVQGANDLLVGLATALASLGSGIAYAGAGYTGVAIVGTVASLVPVALTGWWMARRRRAISDLGRAERCQEAAGRALDAACLF